MLRGPSRLRMRRTAAFYASMASMRVIAILRQELCSIEETR
jgi:hypothetical protein